MRAINQAGAMKTPMESYVVRIYRCQRGAKLQLVGLVEAPRLPGALGFTSIEQLWEILSEPKLTLRTKAQTKRLDRGDS